jgi:hypothetical protein
VTFKSSVLLLLLSYSLFLCRGYLPILAPLPESHPVLPHQIPDPRVAPHLLLPRQRLSSPGTNVQLLRHPIQQPLVLNPLSTLQQLDILPRGIHSSSKLLLSEFIRVFGTTSTDRIADLGACFLGHDDIIGAVHFSQTLSLGWGFIVGLFVSWE